MHQQCGRHLAAKQQAVTEALYVIRLRWSCRTKRPLYVIPSLLLGITFHSVSKLLLNRTAAAVGGGGGGDGEGGGGGGWP